MGTRLELNKKTSDVLSSLPPEEELRLRVSQSCSKDSNCREKHKSGNHGLQVAQKWDHRKGLMSGGRGSRPKEIKPLKGGIKGNAVRASQSGNRSIRSQSSSEGDSRAGSQSVPDWL